MTVVPKIPQQQGVYFQSTSLSIVSKIFFYRISITGKGQKPGAYSPCYTKSELFDTTDSKYFLNHPSLRWVKTNGPSAALVEGAIEIAKFVNKPMFVGRINLTIGNITFQQIGKVFSGQLVYQIPGKSIASTTVGDFEILVCSHCLNGGVGEFCKFE